MSEPTPENTDFTEAEPVCPPAPSETPPLPCPATPDISFGEESARDNFLAWEKLRLAYNAVLAIFALLVGWPRLSDGDFQVHLFEGALFANLCFCVGPWVEGYLILLFGLPRKDFRAVLFLLGTLLAVLLAGLDILSFGKG
jgi:hypothetical protein